MKWRINVEKLMDLKQRFIRKMFGDEVMIEFDFSIGAVDAIFSTAKSHKIVWQIHKHVKLINVLCIQHLCCRGPPSTLLASL